MMSEVGIWLARILSILPELMHLWEAAKTNDPHQELEAALAVVRATKDRQAREEIPG